MEKRAQVHAPTNPLITQAIVKNQIELLELVQNREFWTQKLREEFLNRLPTRRRADMLINDRRARLFLRTAMQRLGMIVKGDVTWEELGLVIAERVEQLQSMGVGVTEKKKSD